MSKVVSAKAPRDTRAEPDVDLLQIVRHTQQETTGMGGAGRSSLPKDSGLPLVDDLSYEDSYLLLQDALPDPPITGEGNPTLLELTSSAAATSTISGAASPTLLTVTSSAAAIARATGTSSSTLATFTVSAAGIARAAGTSSSTLATFTSSATGTARVAGAASPTLLSFTLSGTGLVGEQPAYLSGNPLLLSLSSTATGAVRVVGTSSSTLGALSSTAVGTSTIAGTAAALLGSPSAEGAAAVLIEGVGVVQLPTFTLLGIGIAHFSGEGFTYEFRRKVTAARETEVPAGVRVRVTGRESVEYTTDHNTWTPVDPGDMFYTTEITYVRALGAAPHEHTLIAWDEFFLEAL